MPEEINWNDSIDIILKIEKPNLFEWGGHKQRNTGISSRIF